MPSNIISIMGDIHARTLEAERRAYVREEQADEDERVREKAWHAHRESMVVDDNESVARYCEDMASCCDDRDDAGFWLERADDAREGRVSRGLRAEAIG